MVPGRTNDERASEESILLFPVMWPARTNGKQSKREDKEATNYQRVTCETRHRPWGFLRSWESWGPSTFIKAARGASVVEKQWGGPDRTWTRCAALLIRHEANKKSRTMAASPAAHLPSFVLPPSAPLSQLKETTDDVYAEHGGKQDSFGARNIAFRGNDDEFRLVSMVSPMVAKDRNYENFWEG